MTYNDLLKCDTGIRWRTQGFDRSCGKVQVKSKVLVRRGLKEVTHKSY